MSDMLRIWQLVPEVRAPVGVQFGPLAFLFNSLNFVNRLLLLLLRQLAVAVPPVQPRSVARIVGRGGGDGCGGYCHPAAALVLWNPAAWIRRKLLPPSLKKVPGAASSAASTVGMALNEGAMVGSLASVSCLLEIYCNTDFLVVSDVHGLGLEQCARGRPGERLMGARKRIAGKRATAPRNQRRHACTMERATG